MMLEILIGLVGGILVFLLLTGYNVFPFLALGSLGVMFYFIFKQKGLLKNSFAVEYQPKHKITFTDVGGQNMAKKELMEALDFILDVENIRQLGIRPLKGILLTGPPGTGKTMLAKAAASYTDALFFAASGSEFIEIYAGVGAQRVREIFRQARQQARREKKSWAIIFIDEIEVLGTKRGGHSSHLEYDQTLNQLLVELDGLRIDEEVRILVIGATNRADLIDPALLRPGRFDRIVQVDLPDKEGRLQILKLHTKNKPLAQDVDLEALARETFGFSGAHLESLANEAAILALRAKAKKITQKHLKEAVDKVMLGEKLDRRPSEEELERVAVHESGHALISELEEAGSVARVTITPRGQALGYVRQSPRNDVYLQTRACLERQIKIALAGAVAEEIVFQERSTGAANDIQDALKIAQKIVECGLSDLGVIDPEHSSELVGQAVRRIISQQEIHLRQTLMHFHGVLMQIAFALKKKESLTGDELRSFIRNYQGIA
ncbi:MAG: AAA family ATPase [Clostridia bacterium]|jgi:ATP-dependent metalloprotease FtsH|nr:AAA family ATPase [Clostridia bacterium]